MTCTQCNNENRGSAKYCRICGSEIKNKLQLKSDKIIGRFEIRQKISDLVTAIKQYKKAINSDTIFNSHTLILGNYGTGKSIIANYFISSLSSADVINNDKIIRRNCIEENNLAESLPNLFESAKSGLLFLDNFHHLLPSGENEESKELEILLNLMEKYRSDPIVVVSANKNKAEQLLVNQQHILNRFEHFYNLMDYTSSELYEICRSKIETYGLVLKNEPASHLLDYFKYLVKNKNQSFGNALTSINTSEDIVREYYLRTANGDKDDKVIRKNDIKYEFPIPKNLDEIFAEVDELIGLENIKAALHQIADQVTYNKLRKLKGEKVPEVGFHLVLTGNPGTGKTTIARKIGEILSAIGYLDRGHVIEVDKSGLVGRFVGETPYKVSKVCERAMGGVLFIDEAYALGTSVEGGTNDGFSKEAVEVLLKNMEDHRTKFVVIAAGYRNEMERFLNTNPGLRSRFDRIINIENYNEDELSDIFSFFIEKNGYNIGSETTEKIKDIIHNIYLNRSSSFANAREIRALYEKSIINLSQRTLKDFDREIDHNTILPEDLPGNDLKGYTLDEVFSELDELAGLENIKFELKSLSALVQAETKRAELLGTESPFNYHFIFKGNPGTGKTTVARLVGKIFKSLGLLSKGHLIEVDRAGLIGKYVGHTSQKVNEVINSAMGGVLFIDEAYSLSGDTTNNDFGKYAIQTILKRMEDDKGKFIVIAAGYPNEMDDFINANPGLESRFKKKILFLDYNPSVLFEIFISLCRKKQLVLDEEAKIKLHITLEQLYNQRTKNFGNGRTVRNLFENTLEKQSLRLAPLLSQTNLNKETLITITAEDILL